MKLRSIDFCRVISVILLMCLLGAGSSHAQGRVDQYITTTFSGTVQSISSTGNPLSYDDDGVYSFNAPFSFVYDSTTVSSGTLMYIMDNGMIGVGSSANASYNSSSLGFSTYPNLLCILNTDLNHNGNPGNYWQVTGTSPNRVLTMEEYNVEAFGYSTESVTIQTKIYESTGVIEFWYSNYNYTINGSDGCQCVSIGLNGGITPSFKYLTYVASSTTTPGSNVRFTPPPPPKVAQLSVQPKSVDFGFLQSGQSSTLCSIIVRNTGPSDNLLFRSISMSGNADFSIVGATPTSLAPGLADTICIRFGPLASGNRSATLTFITNGRDSAIQLVSLHGFGIAPGISVATTSLFKKTRTKLGDSLTQSFLVSSTGTGPLTFLSITPTGLYAGEYAVTRMPLSPLPQGTSDTISVTYKPTQEGSRPAFLAIQSNALNLPSDTIKLFGVGTLPRLTVTPEPLNFDSVGVGDQRCSDVTLYNPGTDTVLITHNYLSSFDADYTITPLTGLDTIIPPDKSRTIHVCFTPIRNGLRQARLRVTTSIPLTFEEPRRDTSSFFVDIIGEGVPFGRLSVRGTAIIDSAIVGQKLCKTDTFYNSGSAAVTISGATITGTSATDYVLTGVTFPIVVQPGQSQVFTLCVTPAQRGDRTAFLNLAATSNGKPINDSLPLDIFGQLVCASATPSSAFATKTCVGMTDTAWVVVSNCGDVATPYTASIPTTVTTYAVAGAATSTVVGPNGKATFPITFTPTDRTPQNATLTITGNNGVLQTVTLTGTGQAAIAVGSGVADTTHMQQSSNFNLKINNTGECEWNPGTPTFSDPQFSYVSGSTNIPAGGSGTIVVKFAPTKGGLQTATLAFPTAIGVSLPAANVTVSGFATGVQGVAQLAEANGYSLKQNYPNPFNPTTEIRFVVAKEGTVTMNVIDVTGKVVRNVLNERMSAGEHSTVVNASELSSGVYYYQLIAGSTVLTRQMVLAK